MSDNPYKQGTFTDPEGTHPHLKGKTALVDLNRRTGRWMAQFDDRDEAEAFGWWAFPTGSFDLGLPLDENGCHTMPNGDCVSPGPCIHNTREEADG